MALESTTTEPKVEDFTPLSSHQEATPSAFFDAKPVLHHHSPYAALSLSIADLISQPALKTFDTQGARSLETYQETTGNSEAELAESSGTSTITGLDIWVTSRQLTLFAPQIPYGVHIPYQSIVVHATEGDQVLLGLNLSNENTPDEEMSFVQLRLIPQTSKAHPANHITDPEERSRVDGESDLSLFNAISACQELNPDAPEEGEEGFDETAPGATGWITSENMADFMDETGEFKMPEGVTVIGGEEDAEGANGTNDTHGANGLGEGAGRVRSADEVDGEGGAEDGAKWQRTG